MQKILVAEDDVILREILMGKLTSAGFTSIGVEDGARALEVIRAEKPDMILLDMMLPIKNGTDILTEMHADPVLSLIPVLAISNSDDADTIRKAKEMGARDFLIKAIFDSSDVLEKVHQILRSSEAHAAITMPATPMASPVAPVAAPVTTTPSAPAAAPIPPTPAPVSPVATLVATMPTPVVTQSGIPAGAVPASSPRADTSANGKKKILIVEDDRFLREIASQKLEADGFVVESATNGTEALEHLEKNARPDIIVLDLILPGISGFEVLEKVKQNAVLKDIPVVILSNLGQEEDIEKAKSLGATDYLVKAHFSFAEIIKKIREIIG